MLIIVAIAAIFSIGFLSLGIIAIQDKYEPERSEVENIINSKNEVSEIVLVERYNNLINCFGKENIQIDYRGESFKEIRITHVPTGKKQFGNNYDKQIENIVFALEKLKLELEKP